jgi:hypothetical protein
MVDFYCVNIIAEAESQSLEDVSHPTLPDKLPYIPRRRDGDNRIEREVENIVTVLTHLDEKQMLDNLPRYAADSPDIMPSARLLTGT